MLIQQTIKWPIAYWPGPDTAATQYSVFQVYPITQNAPQVVTQPQALLTYDDTQSYVFQVRPSSGDGNVNPFIYGAEIAVEVINYVPCRAWLRNKVRTALYDRTDNKDTLSWTDDELNGWINDALTEFNLLFPIEADATPFPLVPNQLIYTLPTDYYLIHAVDLLDQNGILLRRLIEKPYVAGEQNIVGYSGFPQLGITVRPVHARVYSGHYYVYEHQLYIDWSPCNPNESLHVFYMAKRPFPTNDSDLMNVKMEDMTVMSLYVQVQAWLRVEGQDVSLSRWRDKSDGSKRDDMPTMKQSYFIKRLYDQALNDRRETRPRSYRLSRR